MVKPTPFEIEVSSQLEITKTTNETIREEFVWMKTRLQRMEDFMLKQKKECAVLWRYWRTIDKVFGELWELKMDVAAMRRGQDVRRFWEKDDLEKGAARRFTKKETREEETREEVSASSTLQAPGRIQ